MATNHFEHVPLTSINSSVEVPSTRSKVQSYFAKGVQLTGEELDPLARHFRRERLTGFGDAVPVRSQCVKCGQVFSGDLRDGIIDDEKQHVLSCAKR